ncbi:MAG: glycosyltransferase family 2 protein, partial [Streptosporangiaceae bacterium]
MVSVIVPTLNRPAELGEVLASIAVQQGIDPAEAEVIIVNDGGRPVDRVVAAARERGLVVRLVTHRRRLGLPSARNTGIEHARSRYLAFLDDDDVFLPRHLATALATLESGADMVSTTCLVSDHRVDPSRPVHGGVRWDVEFDPVLLEACNLFPVHTAVLRTVTGTPARFDPLLPAVEDWDFWLRLTRHHGYRVVQVPEPTVIYHRIPQASSMIGAVAENTATMAEFSELVRRLWSRWPASTARSGRFRLYSGVMYWQVMRHLATGRRPDPHYYL